MGFLREMFGTGLAKDDPRAFLVEAMVAAIDADGEVTEAELEGLHKRLDVHEAFAGLTQDQKQRLIDQAADAVENAGGGRNRVDAIAQGLPSRSERTLAYNLACELCVADNELAETEIVYLESLQNALGLPDEEARAMFEAARTNSSVMTIEERGEKMKSLTPRFIDAMVLLTLADGKVEDAEIERMEAVLRHIADMRSLDEASLHDEVVKAFDRVAAKSPDEVINEIAAAITNQTDRFWTVTYMMLVAIADGAQDWQELGVLARVQKILGLDSEAMDKAMNIAKQFPKVKITGKAPV